MQKIKIPWKELRARRLKQNLPLWKVKAERLRRTWNDLHITTAKPLTVKQRLTLFKLYGIDRHIEVDPTLLGGAIIRRGSTQVDNSLLGQLIRLKGELQ